MNNDLCWAVVHSPSLAFFTGAAAADEPTCRVGAISYQSEKQLLTWVQDKADDITALRKAGCQFSNQPLNQLVSSSARRFKVELIRVQPRNDSVQVWIKPLAFNQLVDWLRYLKEQQGIEVEFLDIDRTDQAGMIDVNRLQFKRG